MALFRRWFRYREKVPPMSMIGFPLLLIPLAIVNILVFLMPGVSLTAPVTALPLPSGVSWTFTLSDILLTLGMLLLIFEMAKAARLGAKYFTDHLLSLLVLIGAAAEFVLLPQFGTSTFFLLTVLALVDFIGSIAVRARRPRAVVREPATVIVPAPAPAPMPEPVAPARPTVITPVAPVEPPPVVTMAPSVEHHAEAGPEVTTLREGGHSPNLQHEDIVAPSPPVEPRDSEIIPRR
jgi:hypothetical protein